VGRSALFAALVATILFLLQRGTHADDDAALARFTRPEAASVDGIAVDARIARASAGTRGWVMRVTFANTTDAPASATIALAATVAIFNPNARTTSTPTAAWTKRVAIALAKGETATRELALPGALGARMSRWEREARAIQQAYDDLAAGKSSSLPKWAVGIGAGPRGTVAAVVTKG
jgi:hypothetical protein